jgi:hypothetical protein
VKTGCWWTEAGQIKFPVPKTTPGILDLVAGVRDEQQKIVFPPVDIVEIPLVARGRVLVPATA